MGILLKMVEFMKRLVLLIALTLGACGDGSITVPERQKSALTSELLFLQFDSSAFAAAEQGGSFWAVKGRDTRIQLRYSDTGEDFLEFQVGYRSLAARPDGSAIAHGDSVLITIATDPTGRFVFQFEPSGLKFDDAHPAKLILSYGRTNYASLLGANIWRRDATSLPWVSVPTLHANHTARADVQHFTEFGIADN